MALRKAIKMVTSIKDKKKTKKTKEQELPIPNFEIEDVLLSQFEASDVIRNYSFKDSGKNVAWIPKKEDNHFSDQKNKLEIFLHNCSNDTKFTALWQTFACFDDGSSGQILLDTLKNLSLPLAIILGEEYHSNTALQHQFKEFCEVPFDKYKEYVLNTTAHSNLDPNQMYAICWTQCKKKYLDYLRLTFPQSPLPDKMCDALYYFFCIFNTLSEPGTYPPSMDYEEAELFLRKVFAYLGLPWTSPHEEEICFHEESLTHSKLQVTFQQMLFITIDMIGEERARSHQFYNTMQRLCLMEHQEIAISGWIIKRKFGNSKWKKRWCVLQGSKLTCYNTMKCEVRKEEISLQRHMYLECLPSMSSHKHRFRVVEKEDMAVTNEHEFSCKDTTSLNSWMSLINLSIHAHKAGLTSKKLEIYERRMERLKRSEIACEAYRRKITIQETNQRLQEAKKRRMEIEQQLKQRSQQREEQMDYLVKTDKIYERLEAIQLHRRLHNKEEREKKILMQFSPSYDQHARVQLPQTSSNKPKEILQALATEEMHLQDELKSLQVAMKSSEPSSSTITSALTDNSEYVAKFPYEHSITSCISSDYYSCSTDNLSISLDDINDSLVINGLLIL